MITYRYAKNMKEQVSTGVEDSENKSQFFEYQPICRSIWYKTPINESIISVKLKWNHQNKTHTILTKGLRFPRLQFSTLGSEEQKLQIERYLYCRKLVPRFTKNSNGQAAIFGDIGMTKQCRQLTRRVLSSKTRVAPIKQQTTPRLELLGALILARLVSTLLKSLTCKITWTFFYCFYGVINIYHLTSF